ncbi:hypothetical protein PanWU01x14_280730, partial [Parasponia andersonii]
ARDVRKKIFEVGCHSAKICKIGYHAAKMATKPSSKEVSLTDLEVQMILETVSMTDGKKAINLSNMRSDAKTRNQDLHIEIMIDRMLTDDFKSINQGEIPHPHAQLLLYPIDAHNLSKLYT